MPKASADEYNEDLWTNSPGPFFSFEHVAQRGERSGGGKSFQSEKSQKTACYLKR
jgi:hypothetical protein